MGTPLAERDFAGLFALKDITAATGAVVIPTSLVRPRNPINNSYLPTANKSSFPSAKVLGKRRPSLTVSAHAKASWFTADLLNRLIMTLATDSNGDLNTDVFACGLYQATANSWRVFDGCKCSQIDISQELSGPISVVMSFPAIQDSSDTISLPATPTAFSISALNSDPGLAIPVSSTSWGGTATQVKSWRLSLVRGQAVQDSQNGTSFADGIASGMFSGVFTLEQSATADIIPTTSVAFQIGPASTGVKFTLNLSEDDYTIEKGTGFAMQSTTWSLFNVAGGNPCTIAVGV